MTPGREWGETHQVTLIKICKWATRMYLSSHPEQEYRHDDILSAVCEAAVVTLDKWDPEGGASIETYLINRLRWAALDFVRVNSRLTSYEQRIKKMSNDDLPPERREPVDIDFPLGPNETLGSFYLGGEDLKAIEDRDELRRALTHLPPRTRAMVVQRYYLDKRLIDVAAEHDVAHPMVSREVRDALPRLREFLEDAA